MENINETMRIFGEDRTAYQQNEVKILMELRDNVHEKEYRKWQLLVAGLIAVVVSCIFIIIKLWQY